MSKACESASNLAAASKVAQNNWQEAQRWKRIAAQLAREIAARNAAADQEIEVHHGTVIFTGVQYGR